MFVTDLRQTYLDDLIFRTNSLLDQGLETSFDDIYRVIGDGTIIEWLHDKGADMSILLSDTMFDAKGLVVAALSQAAFSRKGDERRKLGVANNGLCLIIALASEAKAVSPPVTAPYISDTTVQ
jgi:hypothetical protein